MRSAMKIAAFRARKRFSRTASPIKSNTAKQKFAMPKNPMGSHEATHMSSPMNVVQSNARR